MYYAMVARLLVTAMSVPEVGVYSNHSPMSTPLAPACTTGNGLAPVPVCWYCSPGTAMLGGEEETARMGCVSCAPMPGPPGPTPVIGSMPAFQLSMIAVAPTTNPLLSATGIVTCAFGLG